MKDVKFPGFASTAGTAGIQRLKELTGYNVVIQGADLVIPANDPSLDTSRLSILEIGKFIDLNEKTYGSIAEEYANFLANDYEAYDGEKPSAVPIYTKLGLIAELKKELIEVFFSDRSTLRNRIQNYTCRFMKEQFEAKDAVAIRINGSLQQALLSLGKFSLLLDRFGYEEARKINFESRALEGLLPHPAHMLSYVEALTYCAPLVISLPVSRVGSALHFFPMKPILFPKDANKGIIETISSSPEPMSEEEISVMLEPDDFGATGQRRYFKLVIDGLNRLLGFINDIRNYQESSGTVNFQAFIQAHSALYLIFIEILSMNFVNSVYLKQKIAFSVLNKIANLKRHVGNCRDHEAELFKALFKNETGELIAGTLRYHGRKIYDRLGNKLASVTYQTYSSIHNHLEKILGTKNEGTKLECIRTLRNASEHGTFLQGNQFDKSLLINEGSIPAEIANLPILIVLAMILEPKRIIGCTELGT